MTLPTPGHRGVHDQRVAAAGAQRADAQDERAGAGLEVDVDGRVRPRARARARRSGRRPGRRRPGGPAAGRRARRACRRRAAAPGPRAGRWRSRRVSSGRRRRPPAASVTLRLRGAGGRRTSRTRLPLAGTGGSRPSSAIAAISGRPRPGPVVSGLGPRPRPCRPRRAHRVVRRRGSASSIGPRPRRAVGVADDVGARFGHGEAHVLDEASGEPRAPRRPPRARDGRRRCSRARAGSVQSDWGRVAETGAQLRLSLRRMRASWYPRQCCSLTVAGPF